MIDTAAVVGESRTVTTDTHADPVLPARVANFTIEEESVGLESKSSGDTAGRERFAQRLSQVAESIGAEKKRLPTVEYQVDLLLPVIATMLQNPARDLPCRGSGHECRLFPPLLIGLVVHKAVAAIDIAAAAYLQDIRIEGTRFHAAETPARARQWVRELTLRGVRM